MEGFTTPEGETNWNLISTLLGQGAQAFSAQDPTSWQHQLGGAAEQFGQSKIYGEAATKAADEKSDLMTALKMLSGQTPNAKGLPGVSSWSTDANGEISMKVTPERGGFGFDMGGLRNPLTEPETPTAPTAPTEFGGQPTPTGGAGGQDVFSPFHQALQGGSQQQIW